MIKDVDFVRLNLDPLATTIQANARAWVKELGKFLNDSAREDLNALKGEIEVCISCPAALLPDTLYGSIKVSGKLPTDPSPNLTFCPN